MFERYRKSTRLPEGSTERFPLFPRLIATSFGAGFLPLAPGTWGALVAVLLWLPLYLWASPAVSFTVTLVAAAAYTIAGIWASNIAEKYWGHDPVVACADETVGQWIALLAVGPACPVWEIVAAFILFRFFDIVKPLGIRATERLPRGYGMMADDIVAGIYSALIIWGINLVFDIPYGIC